MSSQLSTALFLASIILLKPTATSAQSTVIAGNPEANRPQTFNQPTKSWSQWEPKATYAYDELPDQYMGPNRGAAVGGFQWSQYGHSRCPQGEGMWHTNSTCQTAWINDVNDWCLFGPHLSGIAVGAFEREALTYCLSPTHGTRLIPDGTLTGVHFVKTRDYVQVTGIGDFTTIGIPDGDSGGEMDPHGMDDLGNPIGGTLWTTAHPEHLGEPYMLREWSQFQSYNMFCLRGCWGEQAPLQCQHIYDILGCYFNFPANYSEGFESCDGDIAPLQGIYGDYTFSQGHAVTPSPHPAPSSSNCQVLQTVSNGVFAIADLNGPRSSFVSPDGARSSTSSSRTTPDGTSLTITRLTPSASSGGATSSIGRSSTLSTIRSGVQEVATSAGNGSGSTGNGAGVITVPFVVGVWVVLGAAIVGGGLW